MGVKLTDKAIILARGLGTRMRKQAAAGLDDKQAAAADTGVKALIDRLLNIGFGVVRERTGRLADRQGIDEKIGRDRCKQHSFDFVWHITNDNNTRRPHRWMAGVGEVGTAVNHGDGQRLWCVFAIAGSDCGGIVHGSSPLGLGERNWWDFVVSCRSTKECSAAGSSRPHGADPGRESARGFDEVQAWQVIVAAILSPKLGARQPKKLFAGVLVARRAGRQVDGLEYLAEFPLGLDLDGRRVDDNVFAQPGLLGITCGGLCLVADIFDIIESANLGQCLLGPCHQQ